MERALSRRPLEAGFYSVMVTVVVIIGLVITIITCVMQLTLSVLNGGS
jgi:hypothetical protein